MTAHQGIELELIRGGPAETQANPFSGGPVQVASAASRDNFRALAKLLDQVGATSCGEGDSFDVKFPDGGAGLIWLGGFDDQSIRGGQLRIETYSLEFIAWLHQVMLAGGFLLCEKVSGECLAAQPQPASAGLQPFLAETPEALTKALQGWNVG